MVLYHEF